MPAPIDHPDDAAWVADPSIVWWVGLTAVVDPPLSPDEVHTRLVGLCESRGWRTPPPVETGADPQVLLADLCARPATAPVLAALADGNTVVLAGNHAYVDGLGLLAVLSAVTGGPVTSSARGLGQRAERGGLFSTTLRRLAEAFLAPPARVFRSGGVAGRPDTIVVRSVPANVTLVDLVTAGAQGIVRYNRRHGRRARRVAVAIGASRRSGAEIEVANRSALLRLQRVERMSAADIAEALQSANPEPDPAAFASGPVRMTATLARLGTRLLARRLGSTLLVSHLGAVSAAGAGEVLLHPVTAGGSGVSLGAGTNGDHTLLSLRTRGHDHDPVAAAALLDDIVAALPPRSG